MSFDFNNHVPRKAFSKLGKPKEKEFSKQEKRISKLIGGHQTKASGASTSKGDCFNNVFRIECKSTEKKSLSLKMAWLDKITGEARDSGRKPGLSFQFNDSTQRWIAVDEQIFRKMFEFCYATNKDMFL